MKAEKNTNFNKRKNATTRGSFFATSRFLISFILIFSMLFSLCGCGSSSEKQTKTAVYSFGDVSITAYGMSEADFESMQE